MKPCTQYSPGGISERLRTGDPRSLPSTMAVCPAPNFSTSLPKNGTPSLPISRRGSRSGALGVVICAIITYTRPVIPPGMAETGLEISKRASAPKQKDAASAAIGSSLIIPLLYAPFCGAANHLVARAARPAEPRVISAFPGSQASSPCTGTYLTFVTRRESLFDRRRDHPPGHLLNHVIRHNAIPQTISALAFLGRHVEEHRLDIALMQLADLDIRTPFRRRQISRVDVGDRPLQLESYFEKPPQRRERLSMNGLIRGIVAQQPADLVARKHPRKLRHVCRFTGTRKPHEHNNPRFRGMQRNSLGPQMLANKRK